MLQEFSMNQRHHLNLTILAAMLVAAILLASCREAPTATPAPAGSAVATQAASLAPTETPAQPTAEPQATEEPAAPTPSPAATGQFSPAEVVNDEGGPRRISGEVTYTNPFFTLGVAEPVVILEDQTGFVTRNEGFLMPVASQTLGQITSDFYTSPFSYTVALPIEPQGLLNDVDQDGEEDKGVQVFAIAYWTNIFGDPYLEERDLFGGGWSTAYASTEVSDKAETEREIIGGKFLIYAPDDQQGFPSGFGEDGLLFTEDDPIVQVPQGYSVVDMNDEPFTFDRAEQQVVDLIEPESAALDDYSDLSYPEAFDALVDQLSEEYAFTDYKGIDWEALREEFRPRFEEAQAEGDSLAYQRALRDFAWSIPDGHVSGPQVVSDFQEATAGGLGIAIRDVDDGRTIVDYLLPNSPADEAGIALGAEILSINDTPIDEFVDNTIAYSAPFSTEHFERLQKLRYATRFPLDASVDITWINPDSEAEQSANLTVVPERESFVFSSFNVGQTGFEQPVEYEFLEDSGLGYVQIFSFADNELLTVQLWERLMSEMNQSGVPGLIVDMRQNGGGSGFLADQMAAYFFEEPLVLGNVGHYDEDLGEFYFDPRTEERFYLPAEELRYQGNVAVIVGPNCASACEFFVYDMTQEDRAAIVGQYPTAGLGGSVSEVLMPEGEPFRFTSGRAVDADGNIHIEGKGVPPTLVVPVNEETLLGGGDPLLEAAVDFLSRGAESTATDGGDLAVGDEVSGTLEQGERIRYRLDLSAGDTINLALESDDFEAEMALYDEGGQLLGNTETLPEPAVEGLAVPLDVTLFLEVYAGDDGSGDFTLRIEDASG
jgi:C-terminal processing protease CtpA/Prc